MVRLKNSALRQYHKVGSGIAVFADLHGGNLALPGGDAVSKYLLMISKQEQDVIPLWTVALSEINSRSISIGGVRSLRGLLANPLSGPLLCMFLRPGKTNLQGSLLTTVPTGHFRTILHSFHTHV